ncbi:MAG: SDR family oxidoreductase [Schleiferiaceae bacterium]|nr:SDR family oxidoreductase [Schleiferiaceae bacterium]
MFENTSMPVLVTGATGYVAGWLVKRLLEEGHTVHATVRQPAHQEKRAHLDELGEKLPGTLKIFQADLLEEGSFAQAMEGCSVVFHTASPFTLNVEDPQKELIDPAVKGTENVLQQAKKNPTVQRVVLTSSCAAIYTDASDTAQAPEGGLTEAHWNETASLEYQPYSYSKTLAERRAWELAQEQQQWDLVTINPSFVLGPALQKGDVTSESYNLLRQLGDGTMKQGVPRMGIGLVDVRDVAEAHYRAAFTPTAQGRYITSGHNTDFLEIAQQLLPRYGGPYPIPRKALPKWLLLLIGPLVNKIFSRKMVRRNVNVPFRVNNQKIKKELDLNFRPMRETVEDSFQYMIDSGFFATAS